jgi:hypothetical protein
MRKCTKCGTEKEATIEYFNQYNKGILGLSTDCKECRAKYQKAYRDKDPEKIKERQKRSYYKHKEKRNSEAREWAANNRSYINSKVRHKRATDPMFRIASNIRRAINGSIVYNKSKKSSKLSQYLGCNSQEFKKYLESLFQAGMTWDNYGYGNDKWNIDHKTPLASAKGVEDLYLLNHFSNLQPMWQPENFAKRDKMPDTV